MSFKNRMNSFEMIDIIFVAYENLKKMDSKTMS